MHFVLLMLTMVVVGMCEKIKPCANKNECRDPDGNCAPLLSCFVDPCDHATCPSDPCATCTPNYCGGCHAVFYNEAGKVVDDCKCNEVQCVVSPCQSNTCGKTQTCAGIYCDKCTSTNYKCCSSRRRLLEQYKNE
eukprot:UN05843